MVQVQPLDGAEWGVSIAVGFGAIIYTFAYRLAIRGLQHLAGGRSWISLLRGNRFAGATQGSASMGRSGSGRTASGRALSGRFSARTASGGAQASPRRGSASKIAPMGPDTPSGGHKAAWA